MRLNAHISCLLLTVLLSAGRLCGASPVWPPAPAQPRVQYLRELELADLKPQAGLLGRIGRLLGGGDEDEVLKLPFDLLVGSDRLYLVCLERPALVVIDVEENSYRQFDCKDHPLVSPIALARQADVIYVSDSGNGTVYRLVGDDLEPWVTSGLVRPTGLAVLDQQKLVLVVDTGDHRLKFFDHEGRLVKTAGERGDGVSELNFPTFAALAGDQVLVNDTLNYQIKRFDGTGSLLGSFGQEGDGPGSFARPKGLTADLDGNTWVVDALFDNIQVFSPEGRLLLVVGGPGQAEGEFWSPTGIAMAGDEVYIADTFNNRIQVLRYLGGDS